MEGGTGKRIRRKDRRMRRGRVGEGGNRGKEGKEIYKVAFWNVTGECNKDEEF